MSVNPDSTLLKIPFIYDDVLSFSEDLAAVKFEGKWGFIDKENQVVIPLDYQEVKSFSAEHAAIFNGTWRLLKKNGGILAKDFKLKKDFDEIFSFSEGKSIVRRQNRIGVIEYNYEYSKLSDYVEAESFSQGFAAVKKKQVDDDIYINPSIYEMDHWGFINENLDLVIPCEYRAVKRFSEGLAAVKVGKHWGFININNDLIFDVLYSNVKTFNDGMAAVETGHWGYIARSGDETISISSRFEQAKSFSNQVAAVKYDGKWGFINKRGEEFIANEYDNALSFSGGYASLKKGDKWAIIKLVNPKLEKKETNQNSIIVTNSNNELSNNKEEIPSTADDDILLNDESTIENTETETVPVEVIQTQSTLEPITTINKKEVKPEKIKPHKAIPKILPTIYWKVPAANVETQISTYVIKANIRSDTSLNTIRYEISGQRLDVVPFRARRKTYQYIETVQLQEGENIITLVAENAAGVTRSKPMTITYIPPPKVWAVVVGIDNYREAAPLRYTRNDAYEFRSHLLSPEGGAVPRDQIFLLLNDRATKENILAKLRLVQQRARDRDRFYFYFSGHGRDGNFLPYDYRTSESISLLSHTEIVDIIKQMAATQKIILADACHSGSMTSRNSDKPIARYYDALTQGKDGVAVITSCQGDEVALERNGLQHGVFSYYFHEGLQGNADLNNDKIITIKEAFEYARPRTNQYTQGTQTPEIKGQYDPEMMIGVVRK